MGRVFGSTRALHVGDDVLLIGTLRVGYDKAEMFFPVGSCVELSVSSRATSFMNRMFCFHVVRLR